MSRNYFGFAFILFLAGLPGLLNAEQNAERGERIRQVADTAGLVAFWEFAPVAAGTWQSHYDPATVDRSFPLYLKRIGDDKSYTPGDWPYPSGASTLRFDTGGPFGRAVRFEKGYIYGAVPRDAFDGTLLDMHGRQAFTLVAWIKFVGRRHLIAGIWDEGGWNKYGGRRQVALFGGLFGRKGVIGHISATGASSFPQSTASGSQYARIRAIDGNAFQNDRWVAVAMTFDPETSEVSAWQDGKRTPLAMTDPVEQDVYRYAEPKSANPYPFTLPVYEPRAFVLKYNGYSLQADGVREHRIRVNLDRGEWVYERESDTTAPHRVTFGITRNGRAIGDPIQAEVRPGTVLKQPETWKVAVGDEVWTTLERREGEQWKPLGQRVVRAIPEGAPFTIGRALGLGSEKIEHGSQLFVDGVAVFARVLTETELQALSFVGSR